MLTAIVQYKLVYKKTDMDSIFNSRSKGLLKEETATVTAKSCTPLTHHEGKPCHSTVWKHAELTSVCSDCG